MKIAAARSLGLLLVLPVAACAPTSSTSGIDAEVVREFLVTGLEENRQMDIRFASAIPDSAMRWAPNPDVRDFAEQIAHAANNYWTAAGRGLDAPAFGDTAAFLNDKEALVAAINRAYDWILEGVRALPAEEFSVEEEFFGAPTQRWRVYTQAIEHATWTRGQLVPYFHAHGVDVPGVKFY